MFLNRNKKYQLKQKFMLQEHITNILKTKDLIVKRDKEGFIRGSITPTNQKKSYFYLSWGDDYVYLRIRGKDESLKQVLEKIIGATYVKGTCMTWRGKEILYAWHKETKEQKEFLKSTSIACSLNTGFFSFLGWQKVEFINK